MTAMEVCSPDTGLGCLPCDAINSATNIGQFPSKEIVRSGSSFKIQDLTSNSASNKQLNIEDEISTAISSATNPGATRPKLLAELTSAKAKIVSAPALGESRTVHKGQDNAVRSESPIIIIENISKVFPVTFHSHGQKMMQNLIPNESQLTMKATVPGSIPVKKTFAIPGTSADSRIHPDHDTVVPDTSRTGKETFKCEECDYASYNKHYLKQHVDLVHHADRPFKCPFCDYAGKRSHSLREHLIVHSNERPYECTHCNATFRKKGHLTNHTKLHQKTVFCNTCCKSIIHAELEAHMKTCRARENVFVCELCSFVSPDEKAILEHIKVHQTKQIYVCSTCKHMTNDFEAFVAHAETHQQTTSAITDTCSAVLNKSASIQEDLKQNLLAKHSPNSDQVKVSPLSKVRPIPTATSQPSKQDLLLKCSECGFVAPTTTLMKNHMWTHLQTLETQPSTSKEEIDTKKSPTTEKLSSKEKSVYKCVECEFMCDEAYNFVVHMLAHKPELQHSKVPSIPVPSSAPGLNKLIQPSQGLVVPVQSRPVPVQMVPNQSKMPSVSTVQIHLSSSTHTKMVPVTSRDIINTPVTSKNTTNTLVTSRDITNTPVTSKNTTNTLVTSRDITNTPVTSKNTTNTLVTIKDTTNTSVKSRDTTKAPVTTNPEPLFPSAIKHELKESILAKQQKRSTVQDHKSKNSSSKDEEFAPFVHDRVNARYHCTICGYSCEFQRTIKAHIWKHSGNQDIEYPMFQNGPLSIYESDAEAKSSVDSSPSYMCVMDKTQKTLKETPKEPSTKVTSQQTSVSPVAPALAHLLAARAMTGLTKEVNLPKVTGSEVKSVPVVQDSTEEDEVKELAGRDNTPLKPAKSLSKDDSEIKSADNVKETQHTITPYVDCNLITGKQSSESVISLMSTEEISGDMNVSGELMDISTGEELSGGELDVGKEGAASTRSFEQVQGSNGAKKRKLSESNYDVNEMLQMVKMFCASEEVDCDKTADQGNTVVKENIVVEGNVVVETVDSFASLSGLTSIKSQQSSPHTTGGPSGENESTGGSEQDMECGDSGFMSDTNSSQSQVTSHVEHDYMATRLGSRQSVRLKKKINSTLKLSGREDLEQTVNQGLEKQSGTDGAQNKVNEEKDDLEELDAEEENVRQSSVAESAVTLLSLLKKGANYNPACPSAGQEAKGDKSDGNKTKGNTSKEKKPKSQGISSSLLAVIEQLRERARSETDLDIEPGKKGTRKKSRRLSAEDEDPMENMDNVERIEEAEDDESRFRCKLCHYSNSSSFVMKQHMRLHKTKRPFECSLCDFMAESSEDLQNHMIKHCKVRTYQCKLCPSAFNYKSQLRAHMRAHNEKDVFACETCDYETGNPNLLRNHMTTCHEFKQYVCEVCERRFVSKHQLRVHKKVACNGEEEFPLMINSDDNKKETQDQKSQGKVPKQDFKCAKCDYVTYSFVRFGNHMKTHEEPKVLKCELCDFPAVSNRSLKSHMKRHINDQRFVQQPLEQYKCNLCGYVCHHLPSLKSHMWRHASDQNYSYEFTNEVINAAIDYDSHLDTKECCEEDVAEFNKTIREKMRIRLASQGVTKDTDSLCAVCWVTFRCCQCGFEVINKAQLNLHMKTHSDVIQWTLQVSQNNMVSGSGEQTSASNVDSSEEAGQV
ncbi:zinc finger protein 142-like [Argopecten irradians]|uniref:zinc finger protein 142-like n=1 Tax=Argopecten irradians TaxID=31199 RepID=UPI00371C03C5